MTLKNRVRTELVGIFVAATVSIFTAGQLISEAKQVRNETVADSVVAKVRAIEIQARATPRRRINRSETPSPTTRNPSPTPTPSPAEISEAEHVLWNEAKSTNTEMALNFYLEIYPNGAFANQARTLLRELTDKRESLGFEAAVAEQSKEALLSFLADFPDGRFSEQARQLIRELQKTEETVAWKEAEERGTLAAYRGFLKRFPEGTFAAVAFLRMKSFGAGRPPIQIPEGRVGSIIKNSIGMEFVWIPPGESTLGATSENISTLIAECNKDDKSCPLNSESFKIIPKSKTTSIQQSFWIGRYEVTVAQFETIMGRKPTLSERSKDEPASFVSWVEAREFIRRINETDSMFTYSLPSEAEWEYAARAGSKDVRYGPPDDIAWYLRGSFPKLIIGIIKSPQKLSPVGQKKPNAWGLYDMLGGVAEWVEDIASFEDLDRLPNDGSPNLTNGKSDWRVVKGCSWVCNKAGITFFHRGLTGENSSLSFIGFRIIAKPRE